MRQELQAIIQDIEALARQYNWSGPLEMAGRSVPASAGLLIAASDDSDSSDFQSWLKEAGLADNSRFEPLSTLASQPTLALSFERVIIVFTCGVLIKGDAAALVKTAILSRPVGSYAIVMRSAGNIQNAEDLAIIERGLRRLFLAHLLPELAQQQDVTPLLQEHHMLLWDKSTENAELAERLEQEKSLLTNWLGESVPTTVRTNLDLRSVQVLLYQADLSLEEAQKEYQRSQATAEQINAFQVALNEIQKLRQKIQQLMETRIRLVTQRVKISLETVQTDLLRTPPPEIQQALESGQESLDLARYIRRGLNRWHQEHEHTLFLETERTTLSNIKDLVQEKQRVWALVNTELQSHGRTEIYPEALLQAFQQRTIKTDKIITQTPQVFVIGTPRQSGWAWRERLLNWLSRWRFPVRIPASADYRRRYAQLEQIWARAVSDTMSQTIRQVVENVERYGSESQEELDRALTGIERLLEARVSAMMQGQSAPDPYKDAARTLQTCQQRLNDFLQKNTLLSK